MLLIGSFDDVVIVGGDGLSPVPSLFGGVRVVAAGGDCVEFESAQSVLGKRGKKHQTASNIWTAFTTNRIRCIICAKRQKVPLIYDLFSA